MATIVLITGANRGLGKGLLERFLKLPNHTVIAANRNPDHPTSKALFKLPTAEGSKLIVVKVDATVWQDPFDAVESLESQGIDHIDFVIANAGVSYIWPTVADVKLEDMEAHYRTNVYGYVSLFQATRKLLKKSKREPVLANLGSNAGSMSAPLPFPNAAYGPSKGAAGWYTLKIDMEEPWLNSMAVAPGWVHTELGDAGALSFGVDEETKAKLMIGVDQSCDGMMQVLADTTKEKHGGKLIMWNGEHLAW
ncbi:hypothetical protein F5Y04DRAFT_58128 [Hypomontagnella monticulosa]|nr:hypothetical protein F5Y04DRAFT_58128 [Hypomontagnella monticulosa]